VSTVGAFFSQNSGEPCVGHMEPQEPPVDRALLDWTKREKTIISDQAAGQKGGSLASH
jgi:hypothetical protein